MQARQMVSSLRCLQSCHTQLTRKVKERGVVRSRCCLHRAGVVALAVCAALISHPTALACCVLAVEPYAWKHRWATLSRHGAAIARALITDESDDVFEGSPRTVSCAMCVIMPQDVFAVSLQLAACGRCCRGCCNVARMLFHAGSLPVIRPRRQWL